ncbi:MAG: hypothetical protein AAGA56_10180, partial [Myxococcota bacterium]
RDLGRKGLVAVFIEGELAGTGPDEPKVLARAYGVPLAEQVEELAERAALAAMEDRDDPNLRGLSPEERVRRRVRARLGERLGRRPIVDVVWTADAT